MPSNYLFPQPTTLSLSQDIPTGTQVVTYGTVTIPANITITITGTGQWFLTNVILTR